MNSPEVAPSEDVVATIFLVQIDSQHDDMVMLLERVAADNSKLEDWAGPTQGVVDEALAALKTARGLGKRALIMFMPIRAHDTFLPLVSQPFDVDDAEYVETTIDNFFDTFVRMGNNAFNVRVPESGDRVLAMCVQALFENKMLVLNLQQRTKIDVPGVRH